MLCSHRRISVIADAVHFYWFGRSGQYSSWWCLCCDQSCRCTRNYNDEKRKHYNVIVKITKNKFKVWYAAVTQSFFSLSVGFGTLTTYSSYNKVPAYIYNKVPAYIYMSYITHMTVDCYHTERFFNCSAPPPFPEFAKCQRLGRLLHHIFTTNTKTWDWKRIDLCLFFR